MGREHSVVGVSGVRDSPSPDFLLPGAPGTFWPLERLSSPRRSRGGGGVVGKSLPPPSRPPAHLPRPCPVFDPLGASCAHLEVGIGVCPLQSLGPVGCGQDNCIRIKFPVLKLTVLRTLSKFPRVFFSVKSCFSPTPV